MKEDDPPSADGITFEDPDAYLRYLELCGFRGVGFSGGEPLLAVDKLLSFIGSIKRRFGEEMYVWMYTNGDLLDRATLDGLRKAGLDEIRFNISARQYDLSPVELACGLMNAVAVEIPAIPEDCGTVKECLLDMRKIGVRYLNLHQLAASAYNYRNLIGRNYTIIPSFRHEPVVFESEMAALELAKHASDNHLNVSINYCSEIYKARYQRLARRKHAAVLARAGCERITDAGFIARTSVKGSAATIAHLVDTLRRNGRDERLWTRDDTGTELSVHPTLSADIGRDVHDVTLRYYEADIVPGDSPEENDVETVQGIYLSRDTQVRVGRKLVAAVDGRGSMGIEQGQQDALADLRELEQIDTGLPDILSSRRLWQQQTALARRRQERERNRE